MTTPVNTKTATRRTLRFASIDDCLAEVDRIDRAASGGKLETIGNWTPGQVLSHLAAWIEYGYDGYPLKQPSFFIRWLLRMQLKKTLEKGMPSGVRIPGISAGTVGQQDMETAAAAARLKLALKRLQSGEEAPHHSPAFGAMSHADRIRLNLRHAELHLGFLKYPGS